MLRAVATTRGHVSDAAVAGGVVLTLVANSRRLAESLEAYGSPRLRARTMLRWWCSTRACVVRQGAEDRVHGGLGNLKAL